MAGDLVWLALLRGIMPATHRVMSLAALAGRALFMDYPAGVTGSKLTLSRIERAMGQPGTSRIWNTVRKLRAMME